VRPPHPPSLHLLSTPAPLLCDCYSPPLPHRSAGLATLFTRRLRPVSLPSLLFRTRGSALPARPPLLTVSLLCISANVVDSQRERQGPFRAEGLRLPRLDLFCSRQPLPSRSWPLPPLCLPGLPLGPPHTHRERAEGTGCGDLAHSGGLAAGQEDGLGLH
jgi:hypothetical protein